MSGVAPGLQPGEALISVLRGGFCLAVLVRYLALELSRGGVVSAKMVLELTTLTLAIVGSAWLWRLAREARLGRGALVLLALADSLICFASLLSTVLGPDPGYTGLLHLPDPAAFVMVVTLGVLRISSASSWLGTLSSLGLLGALVWIDRALNPQVQTTTASLVLLMMLVGAAGLVALVGGRVARELVKEAAASSERAVRSRWQLEALIRENHDVRSILSAAMLRAEVMARKVSGSGASQVQALIGDLRELEEGLRLVQMQAQGELLAQGEAETVGLTPILQSSVEAVGRRFPGTGIIRPEVSASLRVRVLGGARGLQHLLTNLLVNACEGDGTRRAREVSVAVEETPQGDRVRIVVRDDGPGFPAGARLSDVLARGSRKLNGSGLGLSSVKALLEAGGGALWLDNPRDGGARVTIELPRATPRGGDDAGPEAALSA